MEARAVDLRGRLFSGQFDSHVRECRLRMHPSHTTPPLGGFIRRRRPIKMDKGFKSRASCGGTRSFRTDLLKSTLPIRLLAFSSHVGVEKYSLSSVLRRQRGGYRRMVFYMVYPWNLLVRSSAI